MTWQSRFQKIITLDCFAPQGDFSRRFIRIHLFPRNDSNIFLSRLFSHLPKKIFSKWRILDLRRHVLLLIMLKRIASSLSGSCMSSIYRYQRQDPCLHMNDTMGILKFLEKASVLQDHSSESLEMKSMNSSSNTVGKYEQVWQGNSTTSSSDLMRDQKNPRQRSLGWGV